MYGPSTCERTKGSLTPCLVGLVHLWTDQRIPGPMSCRCPSGSLEDPPRWHATIYLLFELVLYYYDTPFSSQGSGLYNGGLYIMFAQYEHEGDYTCVVESTSGDRIERSAYIMVQGIKSLFCYDPDGMINLSKCRFHRNVSITLIVNRPAY